MLNTQLPPGIRGVVFDVGETLIDESRGWIARAELAGVTPFTLMGLLGSLIERGEDHRKVWEILGVEELHRSTAFENIDLYPDALECLTTARACGFVVGIAGNQPVGVEQELLTVGFEADFIASSAAWGVHKPSPDFFERTVQEMKLDASEILYVGDRLDNDVLPAKAAGMRTAFIRRGP